MKHWNRPLALLLVFGLLAVLPSRVPGDAFAGMDFSFTKLIVDVIDPLVVVVSLAAAVVGRHHTPRALRVLFGGKPPIDAVPRDGAAHALLGIARAALYAAFLLNAIAVVSFYWPAAPHESVGFLNVPRLRFVQYGALLPVALPVLVLLPVAESFGAVGFRAHRAWRATDVATIAGLWAFSLVIVTSVFVWQAPLIGSETASATWLPPTFETVGVGFVAWSVLGLAAFVAVASLSRARAQLDVRTLLAAGAVLSAVVQVAGMNAIASTGGQADPAALQALAGRMLVPPILALGIALAVRWRATRTARVALPAGS